MINRLSTKGKFFYICLLLTPFFLLSVSVNAQSSQEDLDIINRAYMHYKASVEGYEARFHAAKAEQIAKDAKKYADDLNEVFKRSPKYRTMKMKEISASSYSSDLTGNELYEKLINAQQLIKQGEEQKKVDFAGNLLSDVISRWKEKKERLLKYDFIPLADNDYALLFNRNEGKKNLVPYITSNNSTKLPEGAFAQLDMVLDDIWKEINRLAPNNSFRKGTGSTDASVQAIVRRQVKQIIPGATLVKSVWLSNTWEIKKNALGIPLYRDREASALYKVAGQKYCVEQIFFYREQYAGGGKYQKGDNVLFSSVRFVPC